VKKALGARWADGRSLRTAVRGWRGRCSRRPPPRTPFRTPPLASAHRPLPPLPRFAEQCARPRVDSRCHVRHILPRSPRLAHFRVRSASTSVCASPAHIPHSPPSPPRLIPLSFAAKVPGAIDDRYLIFPTFTAGTAEILPGQVFDVYVEVHGTAPTSFPKVEVKFQGANAWVPVGALTPSTGVAVRNATKAWTVSESLLGRRAGTRAQKPRTRPNSPLPPPPFHTGLHMTHGTSLPPLQSPLPPQPTSTPTSPASMPPPAPSRAAPSPRTATGTTASPSTTSAPTTSA
jgi:hypothetical protein